MTAADLTEPWWINMGAMVITTLAGSRLILAGHNLAGWPRDDYLVLRVLTSACWFMATFWIPLLAALFIEKHVIVGEPIRYTAAEWSGVFPLGMYAAATCLYAEATRFHFLSFVARVTVESIVHPVARSLTYLPEAYNNLPEANIKVQSCPMSPSTSVRKPFAASTVSIRARSACCTSICSKASFR
ncbi:hypothetical protein VSR82_22990 [Burkholderia sp. JPY481]|uniref:SLAC1 family transporter n=1 Tax=Paraburkholderia sp. JPY465 TaxID=3042285 RepID=UPI00317F9BEF